MVLETNIKNSFARVREHIRLLEQEIKANREFIIKQNNQIKFILEKLNKLIKSNNREKSSSTGNEGVYSNIHSLNIHSFNNYSTDMHYLDTIHSFNSLDNVIIEKEEDNQDIDNFDDSIDNQEFEINNEIIKPNVEKKPKLGIFDLKKRQINSQTFVNFKGIKKEIEELFENFSKQELLTFLTIYQLEDEIKNVSYSDVASKLRLSEGCIRTYISSLIKKGAPIKKYRYNNKLVLLSISEEFRELNLKKQLMALYYRSDPYQPSLNELL